MQRKALEGRPVQGTGDSWVRSLSPPPPSHRDRTPFSFVALIPPERGLFESLRVSIPVSKRRNGGFCAPVSAAKNSVPGSRFGDWFDDCVGGSQFVPVVPPPPPFRTPTPSPVTHSTL